MSKNKSLLTKTGSVFDLFCQNVPTFRSILWLHNWVKSNQKRDGEVSFDNIENRHSGIYVHTNWNKLSNIDAYLIFPQKS